MDWTAQFDGYCERTDLSLWSEPLNAITNAAFLIAAMVMARRTRGVPGAQLLCGLVFVIGIGSLLLHTTATAWAALADTGPIGLFILLYLYLINRDVVGWPVWAAVVGTLCFAPFAAAIVRLTDQVPFLAISNFYWSVPILLVIYGICLRRRAPATANGLLIGAALLSVSIILRSLDEIVCGSWPMGTHFLWHCLNALMLGFMIHVYHAHVLAGRRRQG